MFSKSRQLLLFVFILHVISVGFSATHLFEKREGLRVFFWTLKETNDSLLSGCYAYIRVDSVNSSNGTLRYFSRFGFPTYKWWYNFFYKPYLPGIITISDHKPEIISKVSGQFSEAQWLEKFERTDSSSSVRFVFPILPQDINYNLYEYFILNLDSITDIQFHVDNDSIMVGAYMKKRSITPKTELLGKNAITIVLTDSNPIRIKYVMFKSEYAILMQDYLGYDFEKFKNDEPLYGFEIIDGSVIFAKKPSYLTIKNALY